jgi:hypothetical protein
VLVALGRYFSVLSVALVVLPEVRMLEKMP